MVHFASGSRLALLHWAFGVVADAVAWLWDHASAPLSTSFQRPQHGHMQPWHYVSASRSLARDICGDWRLGAPLDAHTGIAGCFEMLRT